MNISPMCSANFNNKTNMSFKANSEMSRKEFYEIQARRQKECYDEQRKIELGAGVAGLATWGAAALANAKKPFETGAKGYFAALYALYGLSALKEIKNKDKVDLGSEEKNKQYQEMLKKENNKKIKHVLIPTAVTGALTAAATAALCFAKKLPDKLDKITFVPLMAMLPAFFVSSLALDAKQNKEDN